MADTRRHVCGHGVAHFKIHLLSFLPLLLSPNVTSCVSMTASPGHKSSCAATDVDETQCDESKMFVSPSEDTKQGERSRQCPNILVPMFVLHHKLFTLPATALAIVCTSTAEQNGLEMELRDNIFAADVHFQRKRCSRCQTGPWRACFSDLTCWTRWSPRLTCWGEMTHVLKALSLQIFSPVNNSGDGQGGRDPLSSSLRLILIVTLIFLIYTFFRKIVDPDIPSSPAEMATLLHRERHSLNQFQRAVNELFLKILSEYKNTKRKLSVRRVFWIRAALKSFRRCLGRLVRRQKWTFKELRPSRFGTPTQQKRKTEGAPNEEQPSTVRWHSFNVIHKMMLLSEGSTSEVHAYAEKQRQDEEKLINFWHKIFRKRNRRYRHKGLNRSKNVPYETPDPDTNSPRETGQRGGRASRRSIHPMDKKAESENPALSPGVQQEVEHVRRCMYGIFHAFLKDASQWRYWQRNEQLNFVEVVMNQLDRWRKLQLAFEGRILESTFKLTIIANRIVRRFQAISIYLTEEEMEGSKLVREATTRGKGAAAAAVEAHSSSWAHLTEAALDVRLKRQTEFLRTQFEEQRKFLASATVQTVHVESLKQVCHDHLKRLTTNMQRSFDREVEKHLAQLTPQLQLPPPAIRIKHDLEEMRGSQIKLFERCHALAGAAQEMTRQHFQDQQEQLNRMATKLHTILDRHVERDKLQDHRLQQLLEACSEKTQKQLALALEKTISHGTTANASVLQQQSQLRRMCEAHKDQGERISHMLEDLIRQQKTQSSTSGQVQDAKLSPEHKLVQMVRDELQATKKQMEEKWGQIEQQNRGTQCTAKEDSTTEVKRMVNAVAFQLQQQRQQHQSLHETLLIHRRDTLELLKHFTHLALCPETLQLDSSLPDATAIQFYSTVTSTTAAHSHTVPSVHSEERFSGGSTSALPQAEKTAESQHSFQSDPKNQLEKQARESITMGPAATLDTQGGKQPRQVGKDQTIEETLRLQPACGPPTLPAEAEEPSCRNAVPIDTSQKRQENVQKTPGSSTRLEIERLIQTQKFELLLERWKRSIRDAEVTDRNRSRLDLGPVRYDHSAAQTKQECNDETRINRKNTNESSCNKEDSHACGNETSPIEKATQVLCTSQLDAFDLQSVADLVSPRHGLQTGEKQAESNEEGARATHSNSRF